MVIFAKDINRVAKFYQTLLRLQTKGQEDGVVRLENGCLQLVIHKLSKPIAAKIKIEVPPKRRTDTALKPVFFVDDIAALRDPATRLGGELNPPDKEWKFDQHLACDGHDPEGNVFQLRAAIDDA